MCVCVCVCLCVCVCVYVRKYVCVYIYIYIYIYTYIYIFLTPRVNNEPLTVLALKVFKQKRISYGLVLMGRGLREARFPTQDFAILC